MVRRILFALALSAVTLQASSQTRDISSDRSRSASVLSSRNPFVAGEQLSYDVSWADFIVAGELTIQTDDRRNFDGVDAYHVTVQAKSVGLVSAIALKVNDVYESFVSARTLQPFRAEKRSRRGKKQSQSSVTIDQEKHVANLADGRRLEIPPETYDLAGLIFAIRGMDLTVGKARTLTLLEDGKLHTISVQAYSREKITTRAGTYDAVRIGTSLNESGEGDKRNNKRNNLQMYVSGDARRIPVLIAALPSWGAVRVELTSATGTKK